jgi:tetratricopeptide (TPR) repeat protein
MIMKKLLVFLVAFALPALTFGQPDRYQQSMLRAIERMNNASSINEHQDAANMFERIAQAEKSEWLPLYHAGHTYVVIAIEEQDLMAKDRYLDRAQEFVDRALKIAPDESELFALQAFIYPIRMSIDPMVRGMELFDRMNAALDRAIRLNPDNPRGHFLRAVTTLNIPEAFGGGPSAAKPIFLTAKEKFDNFKPESPLWPDWGKEHNEEELGKL